MVANLDGAEPADGQWIGRPVLIVYRRAGSRVLPRFELAPSLPPASSISSGNPIP